MTLSIYLKGLLPLNQLPRTMIIFYSQPSQVSCNGVSVFRATAITLYLSCQHLKASLLVSKLKLGRPHTLQHIHPTVCPSCGLHFSAFRHFSFSLVLLFLVSSSLSSFASFPISWTVVTKLLLIQYLCSLYL